MPNEIFIDLQNGFTEYIEQENKKNQNDGKRLISLSPSHIAFAYSYYFYICYLYRYAVYKNGIVTHTQGRIKSVLGYNPEYRNLDYIIKNNGLLDRIGYTESTKQIPIGYSGWDKFESRSVYNLEFEFFDSKISDVSLPKNFKIKRPLKAFYRDEEAKLEDYFSGTFYEVDNTHQISFDAFSRCMENDKLGVCGFYLYGFLVYKNNTHSHLESYTGGYCCDGDRLSEMTMMDKKMIYDVARQLEIEGLIRVRRMNGKHDRVPNTYEIVE